jgi:coenzyme F420-reducing hydrogenase gamma subunit
MGKPRLAVFKFASCDGCQLSLLDCEDELLHVADLVDIVNFPEASRRMLPGPYDIALIEGSITTEHDRERIAEIREASNFVVCIGACATAGGIQALRNFADVDQYVRLVYPQPAYIDTLATSTPISDHIEVDFELQGCPISKQHLLSVLVDLAYGRRPRVSRDSVCMECKSAGNVCLAIIRGEPCLGPITQAGCGALCPAWNRGCYGCFGVKEQPEVQALFGHLRDVRGLGERELRLVTQSFNGGAPELQIIAREHGSEKPGERG